MFNALNIFVQCIEQRSLSAKLAFDSAQEQALPILSALWRMPSLLSWLFLFILNDVEIGSIRKHCVRRLPKKSNPINACSIVA